MKAYSLHAVNDLRYEEVDKPFCSHDWCLVKVKAAGICSSDIPRIYRKGTYHFPTIPGHEFSGVVEQVADDENKYLIGKKVGAFPLIPCRQCEQCLHGKYEMCTHYDYIGSRRDGGFAEFVAVPVWNLIVMNEDISFIDVAMMEPLSVALHAVKNLKIQKGEKVAIVGTGMIAFAASQWANIYGASSVTVFGRSEQKRRIAEIIENVEYLTDADIFNHYDSVLEAVGTEEAIDKSISLVSPGGKLVLMGNPAGDIKLSQSSYWKILRKQLTLKGTWNSSYEKDKLCDWSEVQNCLTNHTIKVNGLISHVFSQDRLQDGLRLMMEHKEPYCKVMTLWNEGK